MTTTQTKTFIHEKIREWNREWHRYVEMTEKELRWEEQLGNLWKVTPHGFLYILSVAHVSLPTGTHCGATFKWGFNKWEIVVEPDGVQKNYYARKVND